MKKHKRYSIAQSSPDPNVGTVEDLPGEELSDASVAVMASSFKMDGERGAIGGSSGCRQTTAKIHEERSFARSSDDEPGSLFDSR